MTKINQNKNNVDIPKYWDQKYINNEAGWDLGAPTPIIKQWAQNLSSRKSICVLGAGNGWDAMCLAELGHDVTAVDFSKVAVENMKKISSAKEICIDIVYDNIFNLDKFFLNSFDIVFEYTCFCAINPKRRIDYVNLVYKILKPSGQFVALFFPLIDGPVSNGPPFSVNLKKTEELFNKYFKIIKRDIPKLSISPRKDKEIFIIMKKNENNYKD